MGKWYRSTKGDGLYQPSSKYCLVCFEPKNFGILEVLFYEDPICGLCRKDLKAKNLKVVIDGIVIKGIYVYEEGTRTLVIRYKEAFDELLYKIFLHPIKLKLQFFLNDYILIPLPTTKLSLERRAFDHMGLIAATSGLEILDDVLVKSPSPKQSMQTLEDRSKVSQYFHLREPERVRGKKVILMDDVVTTGASISACYELLKPYCKRIKVIVVCIHPLLLLS